MLRRLRREVASSSSGFLAAFVRKMETYLGLADGTTFSLSFEHAGKESPSFLKNFKRQPHAKTVPLSWPAFTSALTAKQHSPILHSRLYSCSLASGRFDALPCFCRPDELKGAYVAHVHCRPQLVAGWKESSALASSDLFFVWCERNLPSLLFQSTLKFVQQYCLFACGKDYTLEPSKAGKSSDFVPLLVPEAVAASSIFIVYEGGEPRPFADLFFGWGRYVGVEEDDAKDSLEALSTVLERVNVKTYSYSTLLSDDLPQGVDAKRKELYLNENDFAVVMGMPKTQYLALPEWKRKALKKQAMLY
eukprot:GCRY01002716.1.p1 GENE.GCRY01002716.1~~GCRY01002716.1.p1  ORF type:complete len:305 (-),score=65.97 GCRY01002716.1:968-1882(-)